MKILLILSLFVSVFAHSQTVPGPWPPIYPIDEVVTSEDYVDPSTVPPFAPGSYLPAEPIPPFAPGSYLPQEPIPPFSPDVDKIKLYYVHPVHPFDRKVCSCRCQ